MVNLTIQEFLDNLSSSAPVPGGGGAAALTGAISSALCSMVASLTSGKKKYAEYQQDIERILQETSEITQDMERLIQKDAEVFAPLSKAYGIPKDAPGRDAILEEALHTACSAPLELLRRTCKIVPILEELAVKGSRIAVSDVGVAASACTAAIEGAALNVYINTKLMKDRAYARQIEEETNRICCENIPKCRKIYDIVKQYLLGGSVK